MYLTVSHINTHAQCGLTKKAEPPPTRDVNRDSGTSANGGWRLVTQETVGVGRGRKAENDDAAQRGRCSDGAKQEQSNPHAPAGSCDGRLQWLAPESAFAQRHQRIHTAGRVRREVTSQHGDEDQDEDRGGQAYGIARADAVEHATEQPHHEKEAARPIRRPASTRDIPWRRIKPSTSSRPALRAMRQADLACAPTSDAQARMPYKPMLARTKASRTEDGQQGYAHSGPGRNRCPRSRARFAGHQRGSADQPLEFRVRRESSSGRDRPGCG